MKKIIIILIVIICVAAAGLVYAQSYGYIDLKSFTAPGQTSEQKDVAILENLKKLFPETLGTYGLYGTTPEKIRVGVECNNLQDFLDTKGLGIAGKICTKDVSAEYKDSSSNKVVFIHLTQVSEGRDLYQSFIKKHISKDTPNGLPIFRMEGHEIGWFSLSGFDVVLTQEGRVKVETNGESYSYTERATGNNSVTQYFMTTFPPNLEGELSSGGQTQNSVNVNVSVCTDSDGGEDIYKKGTVKCAKYQYIDHCEINGNPNYLVEYVTNGSGVGTPTIDCPNGCNDGACIK